MTNRRTSLSALAQLVNQRAPIVEPLTVVAIVSLLTSWAIQPFITQALSQQGSVAQGAAQAALWLSGVVAPVAALAKALSAALICWACSIYLDERLSLGKLASIFCFAELVFSLRDVTTLAVLAARGVAGVHSPADLMVAFSANVFVRSSSTLAKVALESWDLFSVGWALFALGMIRVVFKTGARSAVALAIVAFTFRTLFAAGSLLYSL